MGNTHGRTIVSIKVISSKDIETGMEFGMIAFLVVNIIKAIICWIRSMDLGYMIGPMGIIIRAISWKIKGVEKGNYILMRIWCMMDSGLMARNVRKNIIKGNRLIVNSIKPCFQGRKAIKL